MHPCICLPAWPCLALCCMQLRSCPSSSCACNLTLSLCPCCRCLKEMVIVAAMLSAEHVFTAVHGPGDKGNGLSSHDGRKGGRCAAAMCCKCCAACYWAVVSHYNTAAVMRSAQHKTRLHAALPAPQPLLAQPHCAPYKLQHLPCAAATTHGSGCAWSCRRALATT
jgi:hypothetical protein